ncbi:WD40/YVTN/BNR-like repeat-containing protein [Brumimicrobium oceani]|uniref:Glycosyl hydrolase n=1 Tax=Brumimicrobium oceani TaxID=2100725 RepID=A0A2U2XE29_9FLAO|nr:hypothetical protein [Brumimicrobium oceani]PWH86059.1 hypothetical protein DIT68_05750 [Brumimicrobium oceani]
MGIFFICIFPIYSQIGGATNGNFNIDVAEKEAHFDSIRAYRLSQGDSSMKGTGYTDFLRWKEYWGLYMPTTGNYQHALEIYKKNEDFQKQLHLNTLSSSGNNALIVNPVNWHELGPYNLSQIYTETDDNTSVWKQVHQNNTGNIKSGAHVGKVRKLYQHPTNADIIYALGGDVEHCGGGVFVSTDKGYNWKVFGTDQIHEPKITSLAVKPIGEQPAASMEYIFITLATGAVYRTADNGNTWVECGYNGVNAFPYNGSQINNDPYSLPYDFTTFNFSWTSRNHSNELVMTKKNSSSGVSSRLVVAREGGLYYSDNHNASFIVLPIFRTTY